MKPAALQAVALAARIRRKNLVATVLAGIDPVRIFDQQPECTI